MTFEKYMKIKAWLDQEEEKYVDRIISCINGANEVTSSEGSKPAARQIHDAILALEVIRKDQETILNLYSTGIDWDKRFNNIEGI